MGGDERSCPEPEGSGGFLSDIGGKTPIRRVHNLSGITASGWASHANNAAVTPAILGFEATMDASPLLVEYFPATSRKLSWFLLRISPAQLGAPQLWAQHAHGI